MPIYKIQHITKYYYDRLVRESANQIKIYPFNEERQETLSHELIISGTPDINKFIDYWGNTVGLFTLTQTHNELVIDSRLTVKTHNQSIDEIISTIFDWDKYEEICNQNLHLLDLTQIERIKHQEKIQQILDLFSVEKLSPLAFAKRCSLYVYEHFMYVKGITNIETTIDEILILQSGVCQDFAHLLLQLLRTLKIPSRYVSGYICPNKNGMRGEGATHAWVEVYIPNLGWVGIDPTNNCFANEHHIKLAIGRDFTDCTSVKGTFKGPAYQDMIVFVSVGYEDGTVYEDENTVKLEKSTGEHQAIPLPEIQIQNQQQ